MRISIQLFLGLVLLVIGSSNSHAVEYADADNLEEAYGFMYARKVSAEMLREKCSASFPEQAQEIESNYQKWLSEDGELLRKVDASLAEIEKQEPGVIAKLDKLITEAITKGYADMEEAAKQNNDDSLSLFCSEQFSAMADGSWRKRTPKAYEFINNAPLPKK
ncbi:MAG: hypothetical protein ACREO1_06285 [Arenimonas sp.]